MRIAIRRDRRIAGHSERLVLKVREQRGQAVGSRAVEMAGRAVALVRIVEGPIAPKLGGAEARAAGEPGVVLAAERMEITALDLVAPDREHRLIHGEAGIAEEIGSEERREILSVIRLELRGEARRRAAVHLRGVEHRSVRLLLRRIDPAVPEQTALRHEIRGRRRGRLRALRGTQVSKGLQRLLLQAEVLIVAGLGIGSNREGRLPVQIAQRGHGPIPWLAHVGASEHHRCTARRAVGVLGTVAAHTRHSSGSGQARIVEESLSELRHG